MKARWPFTVCVAAGSLWGLLLLLFRRQQRVSKPLCDLSNPRLQLISMQRKETQRFRSAPSVACINVKQFCNFFGHKLFPPLFWSQFCFGHDESVPSDTAAWINAIVKVHILDPSPRPSSHRMGSKLSLYLGRQKFELLQWREWWFTGFKVIRLFPALGIFMQVLPKVPLSQY